MPGKRVAKLEKFKQVLKHRGRTRKVSLVLPDHNEPYTMGFLGSVILSECEAYR